ncbi:hypothetical protein F5Y18DRAFT_331304 [Xylariaceae sp. FL1019]|nr:hypothetical protein F5Y18DRAFT_331304 [Xylariaceae sp. FL1019]
MATESTYATPPSSSDGNRLTAIWKKITGKRQAPASPSPPGPEPGLSRDSSPNSGLIRRVSRKVVPGLPRAKTFRRQQSEGREKLVVDLPTQAERRAVSVDRRLHPKRSASYTRQPLPRASAPDFLGHVVPSDEQGVAAGQTMSTPHSPVEEKHLHSLDNMSNTSLDQFESATDDQATYQDALSNADAHSISTSRYETIIHDELERKWILNLSMHFRDKSKREKFFVTYRERDSIWRRVTISLDYRNAPGDSLERELLNTKFQREKSAKIYEAIRESLQDIQFYETVTNLKLQTAEGRLHVHVVEDVNEIIHFPSVRTVQHMGCRRIRESDLHFDSHMSGFVYKVQVDGLTLIKKEIPGPDTIEEFLYEVNALSSLRYSRSIIGFYGVVVDDADELVKGLLIDYAEQGALIDVIYDSQERGEHLPWPVREKWARQIVGGLSDIHETGFVQGDFTLSNIVIDDFGNAKIIDINRRGCPVGWEPPEATPLIDSNQRISMYIGVKSDLYQLGMVLWALATLEDEPEAHSRPLRLKPELDVPLWYRQVVENCLHENPRARLQATALLTMFPEPSYDEAQEQERFLSASIHENASFQKHDVDEGQNIPIVRTVEPRNSWPYSSRSDTQATSPSFEDEPYYPPRGRSPPSPLPSHHDLYSLPFVAETAPGAKMHDVAAMELESVADDARVEPPRDLDNTAAMAKQLEEELEQMQQSFRVGSGLENDHIQTTGGDSQADASPNAIDVVLHDGNVGQIEESEVQSEDGSVTTPTNDGLLQTTMDETLSADGLQSEEPSALVPENAVQTAKPLVIAVETDEVNGGHTLSTDQNEGSRDENTQDAKDAIQSHETQAPNSDSDVNNENDRKEHETGNVSTQITEAETPLATDLATPKDVSSTESQANQAIDEDGRLEDSDEAPIPIAAKITQDSEMSARRKLDS